MCEFCPQPTGDLRSFSLCDGEKHNRINGEGGALASAHPSYRPEGGASTMTQNNGRTPPNQAILSDAGHLAAKSLFLSNMADNLTGEDAAHCARLSVKSACASAFLAPHMEGWPI